MAEKLRLMTVHAHPDDESSKGAATTARYVAEGHDVVVVTCTGGERGEGVWLLPAERWQNYTLPPPILTRSPGHMLDWVRACKGGEMSCSDFSITAPYAEWLANWSPDRPDVMQRVTTQVDCADYFHVRDEALKAHETQIDPNSRWFAVPMEVQRAVWPTEDYELARSVVDSTLPEDDLFAGVRDEVCVR